MTDPANSPEAKLLVCVGSSPSAVRLIQSASEMAARLRAEWYAVHVATPKRLMSPEVDSDRAADNLMAAEHAGARTVTLKGRNVAEEMVGFAQQRGVTDIILIMVYLLAVLVTATGCGRGPAVLNSLLSVLAFDFCFVPPRYSFTVETPNTSSRSPSCFWSPW